ncbi:esterase [Prauserella muralis]|uniref:Esterase n=2 Tax=Prauserella muralis TaxID=588067 RepID=A0A2V4B2W7_9PSEU|nr:esterase [Prauserella muralis]
MSRDVNGWGLDVSESQQEEPGRPGRRAVLLAGAASGMAAAAFTAGELGGASWSDWSSSLLRRSAGTAYAAPLTGPGVTRIERVHSHARGRDVTLVLILPTAHPPRGMPMSLLLHGLHGSARGAAPGGLLRRLGTQVTAGAVPPYGFVAVDGGNSYWHEHHRGDDPMGMLLEEVPRWLRERGLGGRAGRPFACTGTSMGGFGALLYARRRNERRDPLAAVAAISPALMTSWEEMRKRNAFHNEADWASMDPLRHIHATRNVPTAVWCGTEDPFITGTRRFIRRAQPEIGHIAPGGHDGEFFRSTVPGLVGFLGRHVRRGR